MANCIQCGRKLPALTFGKKICQWCVQHEAAQRGEDDDNAKQRVMPAPWVRREASITLTHVLFGANLAVFLAMVAASRSADFNGQELVYWGANYGPFTLSGAWWRLLTYMFLHGGFLHIAMNMWCLWNIGTLCESLYGRWTYAAVYVITGVAGGVASLGWNPGVLSVGASGALFGLTGALIASFYLGEFSLSGIHIKGTLTSLLFFAGFSLFFGSVYPGIDNACHMGGLISGLILGALIARIAPEHDRPLRRVGVLFFVFLLVVGSAFGVQRWRGGYPLRFGRSTISANNNLDRMIAELQKKVRQNPQDVSAHYALAHAYFAKDQVPEGETELKRVLELQPQDARAHMELGHAYLSQQRAKEAQEEFTKVVAQEPDNARAHLLLGIALADLQNHQSAIKEFQTTLRLAPQASGVYYRMGASQAALKQYDDAIASYLEEREKSGDDPELETALADAYQAKGMTQQAEEARSKASQLKSSQ
jgi:membrane associated rhomboid family serine protease/Flp pilus assembly protein TadD